MMDMLSRDQMSKATKLDLFKDRVAGRIQKLTSAEVGFQKISRLTMNGVEQRYEVDETILQVFLSTPLLPHTTVTFKLDFDAQVPLLVRRGGTDNPETNVRYPMSQWYPKICEYDAAGWHPTPYVLREFYRVWGNFDVRITIDKRYILGGTVIYRSRRTSGMAISRREQKWFVRRGKS